MKAKAFCVAASLAALISAAADAETVKITIPNYGANFAPVMIGVKAAVARPLLVAQPSHSFGFDTVATFLTVPFKLLGRATVKVNTPVP